ncbi:hypothetical protein T08_11106 [Trichinella sp. T8]|nr:hypothetical protein T08_11106 [Trichinella sp. T8]
MLPDQISGRRKLWNSKKKMLPACGAHAVGCGARDDQATVQLQFKYRPVPVGCKASTFPGPGTGCYITIKIDDITV